MTNFLNIKENFALGESKEKISPVHEQAGSEHRCSPIPT